VAAELKLTDEQVKAIRRRVQKGEHQTELAREFGVNRRTIRRRLDDLEHTETEQAEGIIARRLRRQASRERRKLLERDKNQHVSQRDLGRTTNRPPPTESGQRGDPYLAWLDSPKNLSGRGLADARGLVRVRNPDGTIRAWVERSDIDAVLDQGWTLE
jgi:hypothetical protein